MNFLRKITAVTAALLLLLWTCLSASASIGFDAETVYASVFVISAGNHLGSGFALGENCVITNVHVIEGASSITVRSYDGRQYPATIFCQDENLDIAVLAVSGAAFTPLPCADINDAKIGDDIYTIGAPNSLSYTLTKGVISTKSRQVQGNDYIQIDAAINQGNSGGPLLNEYGAVLGINTLKATDSEGIGFSIPIAKALSLLRSAGVSLRDDGTVIGLISDTGTPVPTAPASEPYADETENEQPSPHVPTQRQPDLLPVLIAGGSVLFLAVLLTVIFAVRRKKANVLKPYDPSERTDFEIEIED